MGEKTTYDYYVALITVTETEEAGLRYIYDDWKELFWMAIPKNTTKLPLNATVKD